MCSDLMCGLGLACPANALSSILLVTFFIQVFVYYLCVTKMCHIFNVFNLFKHFCIDDYINVCLCWLCVEVGRDGEASSFADGKTPVPIWEPHLCVLHFDSKRLLHFRTEKVNTDEMSCRVTSCCLW